MSRTGRPSRVPPAVRSRAGRLLPGSLRPRLLLLAGCVGLGCAWSAWIPGERSWNPDVALDPAKLSRQLLLGTTYVDELGCYETICDQRFRVVVPQSGLLTVQSIVDLLSRDQTARMVLESPSGVIGQAAVPRGPRTDVTPLTIRRRVAAGTYFVLLQSAGGGRVPYEITARLDPGEGPAPRASIPQPDPSAIAADRPPAALRQADLGPGAGGGYDPEVDFYGVRTFAFPPLEAGGEIPAGTALPGVHDRSIRRFIADHLRLKGFHQADAGGTPDLVVDFTTGETTRLYSTWAPFFDRYESLDWGPALVARTRGKLTVDILDARSQRIAWHAWSTYAIGPGTVHATEIDPILREAVTEALYGFPPQALSRRR